MSTEEKIRPTEVHVYTPEKLRAGVYANTTNLSVTNNEVVINFININVSDTPQGTLVSRVIITRDHADLLIKMLNEGLSVANEVDPK